MLLRYTIYGLTGLLLEIFWTGLGSLLSQNYALTGHTYIWMFFIYGLGVFLEPIHDRIREGNFLVRGLIWVGVIYVIEFTTGLLLKLLIGYCPWDYSKLTEYTLWGFIRFDYIPVWFVVGLTFEKYHDFLDKITLRVSKRT